MPQELALYNEFDINETLLYFGLLHNMKRNDTKTRRDFLIEFLDLPPKDRLVKNLRLILNVKISIINIDLFFLFI